MEPAVTRVIREYTVMPDRIRVVIKFNDGSERVVFDEPGSEEASRQAHEIAMPYEMNMLTALSPTSAKP